MVLDLSTQKNKDTTKSLFTTRDEAVLFFLVTLLWSIALSLPTTITHTMTTTTEYITHYHSHQQPSNLPDNMLTSHHYTILIPALRSSLFCDVDGNCPTDFSAMTPIEGLCALENQPYQELFVVLVPFKPFHHPSSPHNNLSLPSDVPTDQTSSSDYELPPIFVLNLDRAPQRWHEAKQELASMNLSATRFPGVDGKKLTPAELEANVTTVSRHIVTRGVLGCFLSHRTFWQHVVDHNLTEAIIMEDDVLIASNFHAVVKKALKERRDLELSQTIEPIDVLLLGGLGRVHPEGYDGLMGISLSHLIGGSREPKVLSESLHIPMRAGGTHGYMITLKGAKKLLALLPKANYHVDIVAWGLPEINLAIVKPLVVYQRFTDLSLIDSATPLNGEDIRLPFMRSMVVWMRSFVLDDYTRQTVSVYTTRKH